jgi:pilus assembly protein Flp/PilA
MPEQRTTNLLRSYTMKNFSMIAKQFVNDESGQDLIEYALVAAVIGLGAVTAMGTLATSIQGVFTSIGTTLTAKA